MKLGTTKNGLIYQIIDTIEGIDVTVDICYSAGENGKIEFEYAQAEEETNPDLTEKQLQKVNKVLECGLEEDYVRALYKIYKREGIEFDPNHYEIKE